MKKFLALCCILCLVGCSSESESKTVVCEIEAEGIHNKTTLVADGDKLLTQTSENEVEFEAVGYDESQTKELAEGFKELFDGVKGTNYEYSIVDGKLTEKITMDFSETDFKELLENKLVESEEDNISYISLEKTTEGLEKQGYTCK